MAVLLFVHLVFQEPIRAVVEAVLVELEAVLVELEMVVVEFCQIHPPNNPPLAIFYL